MAKYKRNELLISSYDHCKASQVVLGHTSPERMVSAQPAGWEALLVGDASDARWHVRDMNSGDSRVFLADSVKGVKQVIAEQHNKAITDHFAKAAVAWVTYYNDPANAAEKSRANPQLIEAIYKCAARAKLHPKDKPKSVTRRLADGTVVTETANLHLKGEPVTTATAVQ